MMTNTSTKHYTNRADRKHVVLHTVMGHATIKEIHTHIHTYIHTHIHTHTDTHTYIHTSTYVPCVYECVCVCMYVCVCERETDRICLHGLLL